MAFTLLPAVDVADGRVVRLVKGEAGTETVSGKPVDVALGWQSDGAEWIHLVDIDAAFGRGSNAELLASVIGKLDVKVELSGGIHDDVSLDHALSTGCERVVLSTSALDDPGWCSRVLAAHGQQLAVALDVRIVNCASGSTQHRLAARGSAHESGDLWETLARLDDDGCCRYVVTDVSRDGMLNGPNVDLCRSVAAASPAPVIVSGGISTIADLVVLADAAAAGSNFEGSILGKALYAGRFTFSEALAVVR